MTLERRSERIAHRDPDRADPVSGDPPPPRGGIVKEHWGGRSRLHYFRSRFGNFLDDVLSFCGQWRVGRWRR